MKSNFFLILFKMRKLLPHAQLNSPKCAIFGVAIMPLGLVFLPPPLQTPLFAIPCIFCVVLNLLLAFPNAMPSLQKRPLYLQDIVVEDEPLVSSTSYVMWSRKRKYYHACRLMLNLSSAILIAAFAEYGYTIWARAQPTSYMEICGVVGGVLALLGRVQVGASRILLKLCHLAQDWDARRRRLLQITMHDLTLHSPSVATDEINPYFLGV